MDRFEVQRHCQKNHGGLPVRWTGTDGSRMSADEVKQSARSALDVDRLKSGVTLRQTKISECLGGARLTARPASYAENDDDDDDDDDTEVGHSC